MLKDEVVGKSSFVVKGTEYYVQYEFKIQAANDHGKGPESPILRGFTGERCKYDLSDSMVSLSDINDEVSAWTLHRKNRILSRLKTRIKIVSFCSQKSCPKSGPHQWCAIGTELDPVTSKFVILPIGFH